MKNNQLEMTVRSLKRLGIEQECKLWKRIATDLEAPSRRRRTVNVHALERHAKDGEIIVVPGKVLGDGELSKSVTVAAYMFSDQAREKINRKGKAITLAQLMKDNPKGQKVRILG